MWARYPLTACSGGQAGSGPDAFIAHLPRLIRSTENLGARSDPRRPRMLAAVPVGVRNQGDRTGTPRACDDESSDVCPRRQGPMLPPLPERFMKGTPEHLFGWC